MLDGDTRTVRLILNAQERPRIHVFPRLELRLLEEAQDEIARRHVRRRDVEDVRPERASGLHLDLLDRSPQRDAGEPANRDLRTDTEEIRRRRRTGAARRSRREQASRRLTERE